MTARLRYQRIHQSKCSAWYHLADVRHLLLLYLLFARKTRRKKPSGFLSQKPGALFALLVLSQALTQNLAGVLDRSRGRVPKLQSVRSNDDTLFVNFQCVLPHLRNDLLQIFFLQIEFRQFCLVI